MKNTEIRTAIFNSGLRHWEVAESLGINEATFSRWLRTELPKEKKELIMRIISERVGEKNDAHN